MLASISEDDNYSVLWSPDSDEHFGKLEGHIKPINQLCWTYPASQQFLATASRDRTVKIWDAEKLNCTITFEGHESNAQSVKFSRENQLLASGGSQEELCFWDLRQQKLVKAFSARQAAGQPLHEISWCPEGRVLAAGAGTKLWLVDTRYF